MNKTYLCLSFILGLSMILSGCGGSDSGVFNPSIGSGGSITGRVLGNAPGGVSGYTALAGAYVVAERNDGSFLRRTVSTDFNGYYHFEGLPLGTWKLGFECYGYSTLPVDSSGVIGYSEAGTTFLINDIHLNAVSASGTGYVNITLVKNGSGEPVSNATVTVGSASSVTSYYGSVTLAVPVRVDSLTGYPVPERVVVSGNGIDGSSVTPLYITPFANQTIWQTLFVNAYGTEVTGRIESSAYNSLYLDDNLFTSISITSAEVSSDFLQPYINTYTGDFSVTIPSGTSYVYLRFTSEHFEPAEVGPITVFNGGGVLSLSSPVTLRPYTRDVAGFVVSSNGPAGSPTNVSVAISRLGKNADYSYIDSSFVFRNVPVGLALSVDATLFDGVWHYGSWYFSVSYGTVPFSMGTLVTSP